jgi:hypothetical protein
MPEDLIDRYDRMAATPAAVVKIAAHGEADWRQSGDLRVCSSMRAGRSR